MVVTDIIIKERKFVPIGHEHCSILGCHCKGPNTLQPKKSIIKQRTEIVTAIFKPKGEVPNRLEYCKGKRFRFKKIGIVNGVQQYEPFDLKFESDSFISGEHLEDIQSEKDTKENKKK